MLTNDEWRHLAISAVQYVDPAFGKTLVALRPAAQAAYLGFAYDDNNSNIHCHTEHLSVGF